MKEANVHTESDYYKKNKLTRPYMLLTDPSRKTFTHFLYTTKFGACNNLLHSQSNHVTYTFLAH